MVAIRHVLLLRGNQCSGTTAGPSSGGSKLGRGCPALLSREMLRDEVIDAQTHGARAAVLVMALEVDRVLALHDLARLRDQEAVHLRPRPRLFPSRSGPSR